MGQENQKEGKGKTNWLAMLGTPIAIIVAIVIIFIQSANNPVISVDGVEFKMRAHVDTLTDAGFEVVGDTSSLSGETYDYFYLEKDGVCYGKLAIYNVSTNSRDVSECQIGEFKVEADSALYDGADKVTVNGLPATGMSESEAKENFGIERDDADDTAAHNKVGECSMILSYYDSASDVYKNCEITYDFGKAY